MLTILSIRDSGWHQRLSERKKRQGWLSGRVVFLLWLRLPYTEVLLAGSSRVDALFSCSPLLTFTLDILGWHSNLLASLAAQLCAQHLPNFPRSLL